MKRFFEIIASLYMWFIISAFTIIFSTLIILTSVLLSLFDPNRNAANCLAVMWGKSIVLFNPFWKLKIQGKGYLRKNQTYVLAANHMSLSDIICLFCMDRHFKWVAKDSLFQIPFFGWAMSALGYVRLKRGEHGSIRNSYQKSIEWLNRGVSILIFPEGTRAKNGKLGVFKNGAFKLALQAKKPLVPIVLTGTREIIQRGNFLFSLRAKPKIKILKPISTSSYAENESGKLLNLVRARMLEELPG